MSAKHNSTQEDRRSSYANEFNKLELPTAENNTSQHQKDRQLSQPAQHSPLKNNETQETDQTILQEGKLQAPAAQASANQVTSSTATVNKKKKYIGHYIIGDTLGEGTFGKVKMATHILTGEKVAIKILEKEKIVDVSDVERVSREIHILKLLRHKNIIQLYEIIETQKLLFLVTEYASGGELFDYIVKNNRVPEKEAIVFFQQILAGVEYIHKLKVVHRDLKPENLLLGDRREIKIVDFGLSNTYKKSELLKTACGSPCYAAPEMIAGKRYIGLSVDIWSCGVILFALVCGYLPFEDPNTSALYKKILAGEYTIPKFVSAEAKDLIKNILNIDSARRYSISDIRKHPWFNQVRSSPQCDGIIVGLNRIPIDEDILSQLSKFKVNIELARNCIEANKHNNLTTSYYLLLRKHIRAGGTSVADISSGNFDVTLLQPQKVSNTGKHETLFEDERQRWADKASQKLTAIEDNLTGLPSGGQQPQQSYQLSVIQQPPQLYPAHRPQTNQLGGALPNILNNPNYLPSSTGSRRTSGAKEISYPKPNNFFYDSANSSPSRQTGNVQMNSQSRGRDTGSLHVQVNSNNNSNNANATKLPVHPSSVTASPLGMRSNSRQRQGKAESLVPSQENSRNGSIDQGPTIKGQLAQLRQIAERKDHLKQQEQQILQIAGSPGNLTEINDGNGRLQLRHIGRLTRRPGGTARERERGKSTETPMNNNNSSTADDSGYYQMLNSSAVNGNQNNKNYSINTSYILENSLMNKQQFANKQTNPNQAVFDPSVKFPNGLAKESNTTTNQAKNLNNFNILHGFNNNNTQKIANSAKNQQQNSSNLNKNTQNSMHQTVYQGFHRSKLNKLLETGGNRVGTAFNFEQKMDQSAEKASRHNQYASSNQSADQSGQSSNQDSLNTSINFNSTVYGSIKRRRRIQLL